MASTHIDYRKIDYDQLIDKPITRVASGVNPNTLTTAGVYDRGDGNRFIVTVDGQNVLQVIEKKDGYETRSSIDGGTTWSTWDTVQYSDASHKWDVVIISATEPVDKRETTAWIDTAHDNTLKVYDGTAWMTVSGQSIQIATMPTASSALMGKVFQFIGTTDSNYTHGYFYEVAEDSGTYSWTEVKTQSVDAESVAYDGTTSELTATNVQDAIDEIDASVDVVNTTITNIQSDITDIQWDITNIQEDITNIQTDITEIKDIVEVETMPTPSEESEGTIIQYKGATDANFVHWYFYECVEVAWTDPQEYEWQNIKVQEDKEGTTTIYLTQAQYDALPASKATDGVIYKIYAEESGDVTIDADNVDYDNTTSGLTADNVQDAIDEIIETGIGGDITYNPDSPYKPKYRRVGTQAQYDTLSQYYTEVENDTIYFTI